jgi:hypothetical protein
MWIGCGGPNAWLPWSPDLTPLDFFLWRHLKEHAYIASSTRIEDLLARLHAAVTAVDAGMLQHVPENTMQHTAVLQCMVPILNIYCKHERHTVTRAK